MTKIKDIPIQERPIERLIKNKNNISNEELLAILLKTGTKNKSSKEIATLILSSLKNIQDLKNINIETLTKYPGIGKIKASSIMAAIELGKRINIEIDDIINKKFNSPKLIYNYYKDILADKNQEHVYCIYLDNKKRIINDKLLFIGTINYSVIHPREIFKEAYLLGSSAIICVHNHPSGDILPSKEDYDMTNNLKKASDILGIPLLDHIIITKKNYYSFFENGDIN